MLCLNFKLKKKEGRRKKEEGKGKNITLSEFYFVIARIFTTLYFWLTNSSKMYEISKDTIFLSVTIN
ncbi:hypothetical protein [Okeania sp. KiyG1]|uniref:hypothetical protein n=1 Tax=Okeania sp. KiyG1 TaxID=2720165 RepID=UPI0019230F85|nr:hypothetical protein [Okeania sp. KiyG1]